MNQQWTGKIAFASGKTGDYDIWTFDFASGDLVQVTHGDCWNDKPRWSPNGRWIVFTSNRTGFQEIFKASATGGDPIQLTDLERYADSPTFRPTGSEIAFISNETGNNDIWIMDADGDNRRQVTHDEGSDDHVAWTSDGRGLFWSSDRDERDADIWRIDLNTGSKTQLTTEFGADITPVPSPNGDLIAFVSNRQAVPDAQRPFHDRDKDIWLMTDQGRWPVRLTENQGGDFGPCWSPDGRYLMYAAAGDRTASHLRVIDVSGVAAAYASGEQKRVEKAAAAIRSEAIPLDRGELKAEIGAVRHTTFVTQWLPDKWMTSAYPSRYFALERYPHWLSAEHVASEAEQTGSFHAETV